MAPTPKKHLGQDGDNTGLVGKWKDGKTHVYPFFLSSLGS